MQQVEHEQVYKALKSVFELKGPNATAAKMNAYIDALERTMGSYGVETILAGITAVADGDVDYVSIDAVKQAIRNVARKTDPIAIAVSDCMFCAGGGGIVALEGSDGYSAAFACSCANGEGMKLYRWNGEQTMPYRGVTYSYPFDIKELRKWNEIKTQRKVVMSELVGGW